VSHAIDVLNRRNLAPYGDMTPLEPGSDLTLAMRWRLQPV
jgi:hypothetical protein